MQRHIIFIHKAIRKKVLGMVIKSSNAAKNQQKVAVQFVDGTDLVTDRKLAEQNT